MNAVLAPTAAIHSRTALTMKATFAYFKKLPGCDTLRMILAKRSILVEGPSDELVVQKAFLQTHGRMRLEAGVEVISVNSLAFKRFLDIARLLKIDVSVVSQNRQLRGLLKRREHHGLHRKRRYVSNTGATTLGGKRV